MAMDIQANGLHFAVFPFMQQGHLIPMIDIAKLLAQRGVIITIFTTPLNAARFKATVDRAVESGLQIQILQLQFPCVEAGLPEGCENVDKLPSLESLPKFYTAVEMLQEQVEKAFVQLKPKPNCIISDMHIPYTPHIAGKFNIPWIAFHGMGCFGFVCWRNVFFSNVLEGITSDSEYFAIPGLPDKVEFTKPQVTSPGQQMKAVWEKLDAVHESAYGAIVNSFEELEPAYVKEYRKIKQDKLWCIGPVSLHNKDYLDRAERGKKASVDEHTCLNWLDSKNPRSVIYACLGSLNNLILSQLIELGLGLEASNRPFIWVIRDGETSKELQKWAIEDGFEERIKGRGLVIWGWAPQVLILSHPSIGGFLTHCGWNSVLEGISAGLPLLTWPQFGDQFIDEKFLVQILKIGVRVGVEKPMEWEEKQSFEVLINRDDVKNAVGKLMDEGKEGEDRRERARELGKLTKMAVQEGGSSHHNITLLIEDIMKQEHSKNQPIE
ncbi:Glycosyltransferase [Melia azedarach]|uniref:Glycosyltransferase n=1 Tax=Melia azedarach TaxID=155640 RepID=A0ACC1YIY2_MELAZ|nr:Glycosyltransferase [Melia azedarach]